MSDQAQKLRELAKSSSISRNDNRSLKSLKLKSIAITSGKGGVGKSNTSISLAAALTALGKKVLLFDGDLGLANLHILLGIAPKFNLSHVMNGECAIKDVITNAPSGLSIIPGASGVMSVADATSAQLSRLMSGLSDIEREYDFLIIDGGAGISATTLKLTISADRVILIITPEPTSLADAYAVVKQAFNRGYRNISVVVNMVENDAEGKDIYLKLTALTNKFLNFEPTLLGIIPLDRSVGKLIRVQKNIFLESEKSKVSVRVRNIAQMLMGVKPSDQKGFFTRFFSQK